MFTYILTPLGSILLFIGTTHYLGCNGRVFGCSGALHTTFIRPLSDGGESAIATAGVLLAPAVVRAILPEIWPDYAVEGGASILGPRGTQLLAGLLVGSGTKFAAGCTSGHMLCGIPRLSIRSWVSTGVFFSVAATTTNILKTFPKTISGLPPNTPIGLVENSPNPLALFLTFLAAPLVLWATTKLRPSKFSRMVSACATGFTFGLGLILSGMTNPAKILSFLSLRLPTFDPSLALVIAFAVIPNAITWWNTGRIKQAIQGDDSVSCTLGGNIQVVRSRTVDARLILGSVLFGIGWGMAGICPGPGLIGLVANGVNGIAWFGAFVAGRLLGEAYDSLKQSPAGTASEKKPLTANGKSSQDLNGTALASGSQRR